MSTELEPDNAFERGRPHGSAIVRPFVGPDRAPLSNPFSIFHDPAKAVEDSHKTEEGQKLFEETGYIDLDHNLVVNNGRQIIANATFGRDFDATASVQPWTVSRCSWGSFSEVPRFTDVSLSPQPSHLFVGGENEIIINPEAGNKKKLLEAIDYPQEFIVRAELTLEEDEGNGVTLREMGLWSENLTLFARKAILPINKEQEFGLSFLWRVRF